MTWLGPFIGGFFTCLALIALLLAILMRRYIRASIAHEHRTVPLEDLLHDTDHLPPLPDVSSEAEDYLRSHQERP